MPKESGPDQAPKPRGGRPEIKSMRFSDILAATTK